MLVNTARDPRKRSMQQVIGLVLILPLGVSLLTLPIALRPMLAIAVLLAGFYGAYLATRHGSRKLVIFASALAVLNTLSLIGIGTSSAVMALYFLAKFGWQAMMT